MSAILFVCKANVCRSPAMEFAFASEMVGDHVVTVGSAGTDAVADGEICQMASTLISRTPKGVEFVRQHHSRRLTTETIAGLGLIIVASREERAIVARMHPPCRSRLFTLREAIELGSAPFNPEELARIGGAGSDDVLAGYASLLNSRRGIVRRRPRRQLFRRSVSVEDQLDIPDFHHGRERPHQRGLAEALNDAAVLGDQVSLRLAQIAELSDD